VDVRSLHDRNHERRNHYPGIAMHEFHWYLLFTGISVLFGRALKMCPQLPKPALPLAVVAAGYLGWLVKLMLADGLTIGAAAADAWPGIAVGIAAVGGQETVKAALVALLGRHVAILIVGQLPEPPAEPPWPKVPPWKKGPPNLPTAAALLILVALHVPLAGCSSIWSTLAQVGNTSQLVSSYLGLIDTSAQLWADAHPADADGARRMTEAIARCRIALTVLQRVGASAAAYNAGDTETAKDELLAAYSDLYAIGQELGIIPGGEPQLTSYSARVELTAQSAPQVDAITPAELEALLRGEH